MERAIFLLGNYDACEAFHLKHGENAAYTHIDSDRHIAYNIKNARRFVESIQKGEYEGGYIHTFDLPFLYIINNELQRFCSSGGKEGLDYTMIEAYHIADTGEAKDLMCPETHLIDCNPYEDFVNEVGGEFNQLLYNQGER